MGDIKKKGFMSEIQTDTELKINGKNNNITTKKQLRNGLHS